MQPIGKLQSPGGNDVRRGASRPDWALRAAALRSVGWGIVSVGLPDLANRVTQDASSDIVIHWRPNNLAAQGRLKGHAKSMPGRARCPILLDRQMGIATNSHLCGTLCSGNDSGRSVLDVNWRAHDIDCLYVADASIFPYSMGVNHALTIAA